MCTLTGTLLHARKHARTHGTSGTTCEGSCSGGQHISEAAFGVRYARGSLLESVKGVSLQDTDW